MFHCSYLTHNHKHVVHTNMVDGNIIIGFRLLIADSKREMPGFEPVQIAFLFLLARILQQLDIWSVSEPRNLWPQKSTLWVSFWEPEANIMGRNMLRSDQLYIVFNRCH
jgi:hypothetical protein